MPDNIKCITTYLIGWRHVQHTILFKDGYPLLAIIDWLNVEIGARIMRDGWFENLLGIVIFLCSFILVVSCPEKSLKSIADQIR